MLVSSFFRVDGLKKAIVQQICSPSRADLPQQKLSESSAFRCQAKFA
jgi:hypothetical protein